MIDFITVVSSQKHFTEIHGKAATRSWMTAATLEGVLKPGYKVDLWKAEEVPLLQLVQVLLISVGWS